MSIKTNIKNTLPENVWKAGSAVYRKLLGFWYLMGNRPQVAAETSKARDRRAREGFFGKYCGGKGLDIGYGGDPVTPDADVWDFEHGDAQYLKSIKDESYDFVYSSHTLEHVPDAGITLKNWYRVLKKGGYLILYLPHRDLYEKKKTLPSLFNPDHKRFFLTDEDDPPDTVGIVNLISRVLSNYEIVYVKKCGEGHTINDPLLHSDGEYSIEAVIFKQKS